ncbi:MAG: hypothetical protein EOO27_08745 [Comamonadaceae bacterium]|nr:MAG: hypothetical protein EOO27_08745 [Comamonadaceae bacterium]
MTARIVLVGELGRAQPECEIDPVFALRRLGCRAARSCAGGWLVSRPDFATYCRTTDELKAVAGRVVKQSATDHKRYRTFQARVALAGGTLEAEDCSDGSVVYRIEHGGRAHVATTLAQVEALAVACEAVH